jgi:hypothetical protein
VSQGSVLWAARVAAALAVVVSAVVHLRLWLDGFRDIDVIGPAFMTNVVAGLAIGVLLLVWRHWVPLFLAVGFGLSTLGAFVVSATVGLFGVQERWTGGAVLTAAVSEVVAVVAGAVGLWVLQPWRSQVELEDRGAVRGVHHH